MKNRRTVIVAFLLCAIMVMGVGFAAVTGTLSITGHLKSDKQNFKVYITAAQVKGTLPDGTSVTFDGEGSSLSGKTLKDTEFTISGLKETSQTVTVQYTITNTNAFTMYITPNLLTVNSDGSTSEFDSSTALFNVTASETLLTIDAGNTATYEITVSLKAASAAAQTADIQVHFSATSDNPNT